MNDSQRETIQTLRQKALEAVEKLEEAKRLMRTVQQIQSELWHHSEYYYKRRLERIGKSIADSGSDQVPAVANAASKMAEVLEGLKNMGQMADNTVERCMHTSSKFRVFEQRLDEIFNPPTYYGSDDADSDD